MVRVTTAQFEDLRELSDKLETRRINPTDYCVKCFTVCPDLDMYSENVIVGLDGKSSKISFPAKIVECVRIWDDTKLHTTVSTNSPDSSNSDSTSNSPS